MDEERREDKKSDKCQKEGSEFFFPLRGSEVKREKSEKRGKKKKRKKKKRKEKNDSSPSLFFRSHFSLLASPLCERESACAPFSFDSRPQKGHADLRLGTNDFFLLVPAASVLRCRELAAQRRRMNPFSLSRQFRSFSSPLP